MGGVALMLIGALVLSQLLLGGALSKLGVT